MHLLNGTRHSKPGLLLCIDDAGFLTSPKQYVHCIRWALPRGALVFLLKCFQVYLLTITYYGRPPAQEISTPPRSLVLEILFAGVSSTVVQSFFANQIRTLSGTWLPMLLCFVLMIPSLIGSLILMVLLWRSSSALVFLKSQLRAAMSSNLQPYFLQLMLRVGCAQYGRYADSMDH
ncbi:hypothetical protein B0H15DRAFT_162236 [Mycena belliarum]|uniref:Uncharacterized protein n=1 Tax=Mycena belliarum TaxID=1033014 RepID=A0AAD6U7S7_9AGAR|nr:hypothetical protein B0H15DRAFT_162236 [Mycena belliae]